MLVFAPTGGVAPTRVQNVATPNTKRPTVQVLVRAGRIAGVQEAYPAAHAMAKAAYDALDGIFNAVLGERVADGSWDRLLEGECVNLDGRMSWFAAGAIDATLEERLARHDIHPTGLMAGRGTGPAGAAAALEARVLERFGALPGLLESEGLEAARRPLRLRPAEFHAEPGAGTLTLAFRLPPGAYATAVIREILATDAAPTEFDDA